MFLEDRAAGAGGRGEGELGALEIGDQLFQEQPGAWRQGGGQQESLDWNSTWWSVTKGLLGHADVCLPEETQREIKAGG